MEHASPLPLHVLPEVEFAAFDRGVAFGEYAVSHRINFFAIIWFKEDAGPHFIDFEAYPIQKDTVYLLAKNQVHSIPSQNLPQANIIVFNSDFYLSIAETQLKQLFLPFENEGIVLPQEMIPHLQSIFSLILLESKGDADPELLLKYTSAFLVHLYRFGKHRLPNLAKTDARMIKLLHLIDENFKTHQPVAFYANEIGLTAKRINEILREIAGVTISELTSQLLLLEGKRALFAGKNSIKEIAYELGFADQSYFSRFFKKHTKLTPEQFKQQIAKR